MKTYRLLLWLPIVSTASCGGSGGGVLVIPLQAQMRQLQPGDSCTYVYSGTLTPPGGTATPVGGTAVNAVVSRSGNTVQLQNTVTVNIYGQTNQMVNRSTITQNPDGSIVPVSDNGGNNQATRTVLTTTLKQPGLWMDPMSFSGTTTYSNGNSETSSVDVTGETAAATPAFQTTAFVANTSLQTNYGYSNTGTSYVSPGLGFFVYRNETVSDSQAGVETVTFRLQSTTVPGF